MNDAAVHRDDVGLALGDCPAFVVVLDRDGRIVTTNPLMAESLGYTTHEVTGRDFLEAFVVEREHAQWRDTMALGIRRREPVRTETHLLTRGGRERLFEWRVQASFRTGGALRCLMAWGVDITERRFAEETLRASEARFRNLMESLPVGVYECRPDDRLAEANPAMAQILGYADPRALADTRLTDFFLNPDDRDRWRALLRRLETVREFEVQVRRNDGRMIWVNNSARISRDEEGRIVSYEGALEDITERKKASEENVRQGRKLRSLTAQLSVAEERERRRIATELHDRVSQGLNALNLRAGRLQAKAQTPEMRAGLAEIRDMLGRAIQDAQVLTFEIASPVLYHLGLTAALEELAEQVQAQHGFGVEIIDDERPKPLAEDVRVLLFQAARELLNNVAKHADAGSVTISLVREAARIRLTVADDGVGCDPVELGVRADATRGFGLLNIRERLGHIGGLLEIESRLLEGTRVSLVAPLKSESDSGKETP